MTQQPAPAAPSPGPTPGARDHFLVIYDHLYALASAAMRGERRGHTLQPTALVHEVFLRLSGRPHWIDTDPAQFLATAAGAVRRVLIDHARRHRALKRGSECLRVPLTDSDNAARADHWIDLDDSLRRLSAIDPRMGRIVEFKVFAGMTNDQIAAVLGISRATVANQWGAARAWLTREVGDGAAR
jgi:RNA polymerase sigma factor (TIGR02999 family)